MALIIKGNIMFKVSGAKSVGSQIVKSKPIEHHYEKEGEPEYIKYSCQLCENLAKGYPNEVMAPEDRFVNFSFPEGTPNCPCCGINIDWDYKKIAQ